MLGKRAQHALGRSAPELWQDVWEDVLPLVRDALAGKSTRVENLPLVMTRNGQEEPTNWSFSYSPVFNDDGAISGMMNIVVESTEAVRNQRRLLQAFDEAQVQLGVQKQLEEQQQALQAELAHRMKNTLAMTQAIVSQSLRNAPSTEDAIRSINGRMLALSDAQNLLVDTPSQRAEVAEVVERALLPHMDHPDRFVFSGDAVVLAPAQSLGLSLAIHELATNAAKYGALSAEIGHVVITWTLTSPEAFHFEWKEARGPAVTPPAKTGFGSRLTQRIVASYFRGEALIQYEPDGIRFTLDGKVESEPEGASMFTAL